MCIIWARVYRVYGEKDIERQKPNVFKMNLLGAKIIPVESGQLA